MLDMQTKVNAFAEPTAFINTEHDAAEFNSMANEMKNLITAFGGTPVPLVDYLTEDTTQLTQSVVAGGHYLMQPSSVSSNLYVFSPAQNPGGKFPSLDQLHDCVVHIEGSITNSSGGAITIRWDGVDVPLVNENLVAPYPTEIRGQSHLMMRYDKHGNQFILLSGTNAFSGMYMYNNLGQYPSGVIDDGHEMERADSNLLYWQVGKNGFMASDKSVNDFSLIFNAYNPFGGGDTWNRIDTGRGSSRLFHDLSADQFGFQVIPISEGDTSLSFNWAWGINQVGDLFLGEGADIGLPSGDGDFIYEWMPNGQCRAIPADGSFYASYGVFYCSNCYVKNVVGDLTRVIVADGNWSVMTINHEGQWTIHKGTGTAGGTGILGFNQNDVQTQFNEVANSIKGPIAMGTVFAFGDPFLTTDSAIVQHRLGQYSPFQSALSGFLYDVWGSGFRTETILGSQIDEYFNALPDTNSISWAITESSGLLLGIGGSGAPGSAHMARHNVQTNTTTQVSLTSYSDDFPNSALTLEDGSAVLMVDSATGFTGGFKIWRSTDDGSTWTTVHDGSGAQCAGGIIQHDDGRVVVTRYSSVGQAYPLYSDDGGLTWTLSSNGVDTSAVVSGAVTVGNIHTHFMKHSDGTYMWCGVGTALEQYPKFYTSPTIGGVWTEIGYINGNTIGGQRVNSTFNEGTVVYAGLGEVGSSEYARIFRSTNKGVSWTKVYEEGPHVASDTLKILRTPNGVLYATIRGGTTYQTRVIRSLDNGINWETAVDSSTLTNDLFYSDTYKSIFLIRNNSADSKGFIVEELSLEKDIGTGPTGSVPTKIKMYNGSVDVNVAEPASSGDTVEWGDPQVSVKKDHIVLLSDLNEAIPASSAPNGSIFRNSEAMNILYSKDLSGKATPLEDTNQYIPAGAWAPDSANTGTFQSVEKGSGATKGVYDIISFASTGTDYIYFSTQPPIGWESEKIRFRVSFLTDGAPIGNNIGFALAVRELHNDQDVTQVWDGNITVETALDTFGLNWRRSDWSDIVEITSTNFDGLLDNLDLRLTRNNSIGSNDTVEAQFCGIEIMFL